MKLITEIASGTDCNQDYYEDRNRSHLVESTLKKMEGIIKNGQYRNTGIFEHTSHKTKENITKTNQKNN